jgi:nucleoside-diphosphate-sugar epimerase
MNSFWRNKKVLVTGGVGFIGSHVVRELIKRNSKVTIVVSPKTKPKRLEQSFGSLLDKVIVKKIDLLSFKDCLKITKNQKAVLNLAAMDGGSIFKAQHQAEIFRVNTQITLNILESARINKVGRILLMSSIDVYSMNKSYPIKEEAGFIDNPEEKIFGYTWAKRFTEVAARAYCQQYKLKIAIARPSNVYGPGDYFGTEKERVVSSLIRQTFQKKKINLVNGGIQKKQFIYVEDLAKALLILVEKYSVCDPINIAGKEVVTIKQLALMINNLCNGRKNKLSIVKFKNNRIIDILKLENIIKFYPNVSLEEGLKRTINHIRKEIA